ncbi:hypothetical protein LCGC14_0858130 [marine sediment metagenome]|uniref:Uncharacterized protein n=1 Tax=marine sediment metagenome TaxID=412755 RepID=A0A0F9PTI1_9ZZZZ
MPFTAAAVGTAGLPAVAGIAGGAGLPAVAATSGLIGTGGLITTTGILTGVGTAISVIGAIQRGRALETQTESQQALLNRNAEIARRQGESEQQAANEAALELQRRGRRAISKRAVGAAKGGFLAKGSVLTVAEKEVFIIEHDILQLRKEGRISKAFRESEAVGLELRGEAAILRGLAAKRASRFRAAGGILTGVGTAAGLSA